MDNQLLRKRQISSILQIGVSVESQHDIFKNCTVNFDTIYCIWLHSETSQNRITTTFTVTQDRSLVHYTSLVTAYHLNTPKS